MTDPETVGFLASALVLLSSSRKKMVSLRTMAIASNVALMSYGALADLLPVLLLHLVLLPTNVFRLLQALREQRPAATSSIPPGRRAAKRRAAAS